jgi:hypothetical protein
MENFQNSSEIFSLKTFKFETLPLLVNFENLKYTLWTTFKTFWTLRKINFHLRAPTNLFQENHATSQFDLWGETNISLMGDF